METSNTIKELAAALAKFQSTVPNVGKDGMNPYFKSKYATLENTISTVRADLAKNGLSFSQFPTGENELATILMHSSGEYIKATAKMSPKDNTPQGQGSAITYLRRYALSAILGIATEDDDDGNAASTAKKEPMKAYQVPRKVPAADDEAGGHVNKEEVSDEVEELQREGIKDIMRQLKKPLSKKAIKDLTGLEYTPEHFDGIYKKLKVELEKTDPLEAAFPSDNK